MTATRTVDCNELSVVLCLALELSEGSWKLAFSTGFGQKPRRRSVVAGNVDGLMLEIEKAKERFGLTENAVQVFTCYEAGRDGFWLHRYLTAKGVINYIIDSASIQVNRRQRRAKTDRIDAEKLLAMLLRYVLGETGVFSVVCVPDVEAEDARQLQRELGRLRKERTAHINRMKSLLIVLGLRVRTIGNDFEEVLSRIRMWDGQPVPPRRKADLLREHERLQMVQEQIRIVESQRRQAIREEASEAMSKVRRLLSLRGIGLNSAYLYVTEFFGWRQFRNRREVASLAGLTPTPYASGQVDRELGIDKAGNRRLRAMTIEIAWAWLKYQPGSELSCWYQKRFADGNARRRKIGIVALARKLLVQLWDFVEQDHSPPGATFVDWRAKLNQVTVLLSKQEARARVESASGDLRVV